ncbi:LysR family transcriptional regulator [Rhizobium sp. KVB221]|uniref:LysR family transcriptional regulator n=1 Tax=Rhizobium setariae TaxID=2801340 RepID=A0A936YTJ8_9HYPH|nr:LysR substrate-binding domain-containing protein [Rhizobium setariae]MBL0372195.1 LysR family transcriptional regulator [Rhizobium setariae]
MKHIPSTQSLRALDSFARHGSVWKAADELHLTRSAVSHQLRLLERDLGFQLLNRVGTKVELTEQGLGYALDIRRALNTISGSAVRHSNRGLTGTVNVCCSPGFASSWLCARIASFQEAHPDVRLMIQTPHRLDDVSNPDVDVFIAFGTGYWPDMQVELLVEVEFTPLCSPVLLNKTVSLADPSDLRKTCLLHLVDNDDWESWLTIAGVDPSLAQTGIVFSDMNLVYSAAMSAQGVAMGDEFICRNAMANGYLVRPFDINIKSKRSYYLVVSEAKADSKAIMAFSDWIKEEVLKNDAGSISS